MGQAHYFFFFKISSNLLCVQDPDLVLSLPVFVQKPFFLLDNFNNFKLHHICFFFTSTLMISKKMDPGKKLTQEKMDTGKREILRNLLVPIFPSSTLPCFSYKKEIIISLGKMENGPKKQKSLVFRQNSLKPPPTQLPLFFYYKIN